MGPYIIRLQHEVMLVPNWHHNGVQDLVTLSLCIKIGHSVHNADISKSLAYQANTRCTTKIRIQL